MKKLLLALAVVLPLFVQAQQENSFFSLSCHGGAGMSYCKAGADLEPPFGGAAAFGVDGKFNLNRNWSLLAGLEYQYHFNLESYSVSLYGNLIDQIIINVYSHHYRLPLMAEYHTDRFYVAAGLYYEICEYLSFFPYYACGGACVDIGGKIKLSEDDFLRIGIRPSFGIIYNPAMYGEKKQWEGTAVIGVGYEHRF